MTKIKLVHVDSLSCEAILRSTHKNELIIVSQCGGNKEPDIHNRVFAFHSLDNGNTWTKTSQIYPENGKAVYCTELSRIDEVLYVFLTVHNGKFLDYQQVVMQSTDGGYSWDEITHFPKLDGFYFVRGALKMQDGTIIFPYQQYLISKEEELKLIQKDQYLWHAEIDVVHVGTFMTNDNFQTFIIGNTTTMPLRMNEKKLWQWPEPTIAQLSNSDLVMLLRFNGTGKLYRSTSYDLGSNWSNIERTLLDNPGNKPKLIQMSNHEIALINTFNDGSKYIDRNPLSIWISDDDMKTWKYKKILVDYPGWLSYPDGICENNKLMLSYEFNRHDIYYVEHLIEM